MTESPSIGDMARFVAGLPPSVTRGTKPGVYGTVTKFLNDNAVLILRELASPETFATYLDKWTTHLEQKPDVCWGTARKCLNIFIRDALYNFYLRRDLNLDAIEDQLELPLDSFAAQGLRRDAMRNTLPAPPRWRSIIKLCRADSAAYQQTAVEIARRKGVSRCHLDLRYWRVMSES